MPDSRTFDDHGGGSWPTLQGTIRRGMRVIGPDGAVIGIVSALEGDELVLEGGSHDFVAVSQIDGISDDAVLLADRGDTTFGLGAQP